MDEREEEVEDQADEEELAHLQPLQVQEAFAERMFQKVVVTDLNEVDEHAAFASGLVGN